MTSKRVLITGVAGFIGSALARHLIKSGWKVDGIDTFDFHDRSEDPDLNELYQLRACRLSTIIAHPNFSYIKHDLTELLPTLHNTPDVIVHLAGRSGVRGDDDGQYVRDNILSFTNVLSYARKAKVVRVFYASSSSVYGHQGNVREYYPMKESMQALVPNSVYAVTKRTMEMLAEVNDYQHDSPSTVGLRFFSVYGPLGRPDMAPWKVVAALTNDQFMEVFNQGNWVRDFTYIDDVVHSIDRILLAEVLPQIINVGAGVPHTGTELIRLVQDRLGSSYKEEGRIAYTNRQPLQDVPYTYADTSKLKKYTNTDNFTNLYRGMHEFIIWYKQFKGIK